MSPVTPRAYSASVRSAVARRDLRALSRAVRASGPDALVRAWPGLRPLERSAAFRALDARGAKTVFAALNADGKWLAYLGALSEGAAPLLEGARRSDARLLRRASARERAAMRRALTRGRFSKNDHSARSAE
jgi:hypothetical protein